MNVLERFLKYVTFETTSAEDSSLSPSTHGQLEFASFLKEELLSIGIKDVYLSKYGCLYAFLPPTDDCKDKNNIGFISHLDTSSAESGKNVKPKVIKYSGGDIKLENGIIISPEQFAYLDRVVGENLVITDGNTLLGADNKAGIAEIFTLLEELISQKKSHRGVAVCITPDEEIGRGTENFEISRFKAKEGYTVDGGLLGEVEWENFNAASAEIKIVGVNIHPGSAKGKMKNACLIANKLISLFPKNQTPATTDKKQGFYHVCDVISNESNAMIKMILRDFELEGLNKRKQFVLDAVKKINREFGDGTAIAKITDTYQNMGEVIKQNYHLIENACKAFNEVGAEVHLGSIRGGTDGAKLAFMGIPCPNLSTGGANFHSVREFVSIEQMQKMVFVLEKLTK